MIAKSNSVIGKEGINSLPFPITSLCLCTDNIKYFANFREFFEFSELIKNRRFLRKWMNQKI